MDEEDTRRGGNEAIAYIREDDKIQLIPPSLAIFFGSDLHLLILESWEGGEEEDDPSP